VNVAADGLLDMRDPMSGSNATITKTGAGVWVLDGASNLTGATTFNVNGGALDVNGSLATPNPIMVNSGGALIGTGTVSSTVINSGGFLVPGHSPGTRPRPAWQGWLGDERE
jgi:autotransporter-associated beta strand protein